MRNTGFLQSDYPEWVCADSAIVKTLCTGFLQKDYPE
jgi:hypothetical protein